MKRLMLVCLFSCYLTTSLTQESVFFNEFRVSLNRTEAGNRMSQFGIGLGVYKTWRDSLRFNFILGIAYDRTRIYDEIVSVGPAKTIHDVQFVFNDVSIPFVSRINFGKNVRFFFETGVYGCIGLFGKGRGSLLTQESNGQMKVSAYSFNMVSPGYFGLTAGIGSSFPFINGRRGLVKLDYKHGFGVYEYGEATALNQFFRLSIGMKL